MEFRNRSKSLTSNQLGSLDQLRDRVGRQGSEHRTFSWCHPDGQDHVEKDAESSPSHVLAKGFGLYTGVIDQPNIFQLDARRAGVGDFDVVVKGESRATIEYVEEEDSLYKVKYYVTLPGEYHIEVKYDFKHIPGSPFTAKILDPNEASSPSVTCSPSFTDSVSSRSVSIESISSLTTDYQAATKGGNNLPIVAYVTSPSGRSLAGTVIKNASNQYAVKFPREEMGVYLVNVVNRKTGKSVHGSPYSVEVKPQSVESSITATGGGLSSAKIGDTNDFSLLATKQINIGDVLVGFIGSSSCKVRVFQSDSNSLDVHYVVKKAGNYQVHVQQRGQNIQNSPFHVSVEAGNQWFENSEVQSNANEISSVIVTLWFGQNFSNHSLTTSVRSPSNAIMAHAVTRLGSHVIEMRFLPIETGPHAINLSFGAGATQEFLLSVVLSELVTANNALRLTGDGLKGAYVKTPAHVLIDSFVPISRSFAVEFDGPDRVDIMHTRTSDGRYVITYCGKRPGRYIMSIKYDGYHIDGSPFLISIRKPDETEIALDDSSQESTTQMTRFCRAYGVGLANAVMGEMSSFTVDAFHAGRGPLLVGFDESKVPTEVIAKHVGKSVYEVEYRIAEEGSYNLSVFWAGKHIPGSPFKVEVTPRKQN